MTTKGIVRSVFAWFGGIVSSAIILGILFFIVVSFYIFASVVTLNSFFYVFLLLSLLTDGLFILTHIYRRRQRDKKMYFYPAKLTVVIACYNGEDVIEETIKNAHVHVPLDQIIVVSDASTDRTAEVARATGARVIVNETNLQKVGSIHAAMPHVRTPYVLILDDDTLIGQTFIPTSLLDDGYAAVAFNVMPVAENTFINKLQRFEYRLSMQISKNMRATKGAIGNVSGAIGLFRTTDLKRQVTMHSGQFAGEDEQRTLLAHLHSEGKGVAYTDSLVLTQAPANYQQLLKQRAFSWSLSIPELFVLYWRVLLSPKFNHLLKADKAYLMYIYLTDPLRILFFWAMVLRPANMMLAYGFYLMLNILIWLRLGRKDEFKVVLLMPLYTLGMTVCRFIAHFYWLKEKSRYLLRKLHRPVTERLLLAEYAVVFLVIAGSWALSANRFMNDMQLFRKIQSQELTSNEDTFRYEQSYGLVNVAEAPPDADYLMVTVSQGDNMRAIAHRAVDKLVTERPELIQQITPYERRWKVDAWLERRLSEADVTSGGLRVSKGLVVQAIAAGQKESQQ